MGGLADSLAYWRHTGSEVRCEIGDAQGTFDAHIACLYYSLIITDRYTAPSLVASHNQANERVRRKKKIACTTCHPLTIFSRLLIRFTAPSDNATLLHNHYYTRVERSTPLTSKQYHVTPGARICATDKAVLSHR